MEQSQLDAILERHQQWLGQAPGYRSGSQMAILENVHLGRLSLIGPWNLSRVDFRGADLRTANLPYRIVQVGPMGSRGLRGDYLVYQVGIDEVNAGCFFGTLEQFAQKVEEKHGDDVFGQEYQMIIPYLRFLREQYLAQEAREAEIR